MTDAARRLRVPVCFATLAVALACFGPAARGETADPAAAPEPLAFPESQLEPLRWAKLEGWAEDDHASAFTVFQASCKPLVARAKSRRSGRLPPDTRPMRAALTEVCERALEIEAADAATARTFFEENFRPVKVGKLGEETGLLTGYYEPVIEGSRFPSDDYVVPVYAPPTDLVAPGKRRADEHGFPNKGKVGRRVDGNKVVPYHDRSEIEEGVLAGNGLEICWVKDPIDAFFMQIQGSARVKLDTGKTLRLNYAAHNGHPYTAVGRLLIERNIVPKEQMSMDRIREWMERNPDEGKDLRRQNRSYVFMRETGLADDAEPTGAQGISLTPGRSIAVDKALHVYGTPFFISAKLPIDGEQAATPFRRLMVAQDTGSAIIGLARADIYWGAGDVAGRIAGRIKQQGEFTMLVPKALDPALADGTPPIPIARPPQPDDPPVLVAAAPPTLELASATARAVFDTAMTDRLAAAPPKNPALAYAAEPGPGAFPVPMPRMRPDLAEPAMMSPRQAPDWFTRMVSMSAQAEPAPLFPPADPTPAGSFASAQAAIAAATSVPAAFAAPETILAAIAPSGEAWSRRAVPLPRRRPQGTAPDPQ